VLVAQTGSSILHGYESITEQVLGVVRGYRHEEYLRRYYPHISTISFETERESLRALSMGKVDLSVGSLLAVNSHIQQEGFDNIQVIGLAQPHDQLRIGVSRNIDSDLLDGVSVEDVVTRINKAIAMIPESSHVDIFRQWNNVKYVENTDYKIFVWPTLIMAVFAIMLAWRARSVSSLNDSLAESNAELEKLQEQLVEKNRNLAFLSIHDSLTGLFNRNFILQRAEEAVNAFERFKQPVCLIVMDVDHFKRINEKYGHSTGDRLLKVIAEASSRSLREVDLIARWGGEEFLILCPYSDSEAAIVLVERIQQAMQDVKLGIPERITCSFGIAELRTGEDFSTWFDNADKSMYRAKQAGRNQLSVYKDKF
jgi:diguanylate cyclase (GGDEF)-like protein